MHSISVVGCGYLGVTHAAGMAELGHQVVGVDTDARKVALLAEGRLPFYEPGLDELVGRHLRSGNLRFTTSYADAADAEVHFLCVGTPSRDDNSADLSYIENAARALAPHLARETLVVGKSTVPVGTGARLAEILHRDAPAGTSVSVAWNPEFLSEGRAVADTLEPDRLVLGVTDPSDEKLLRDVYAPLLEAGVPLVVADIATAEVVKTAANSFTSTKISFINAIAEFCEACGADVKLVSEALALDPRIGGLFLKPGLGFGGGCMPKDIRAFQARADELGVGHSLAFLAEVDAINLRRRARVVAMVREQCGGTFEGRRVAVLGAAFKPGTDDIRDSPALHVADAIHREGAQVALHDPQAMENARRAFPELVYEPGLLDAGRGADAVALLTDWPEFTDADPGALGEVVRHRRIVDARNVLDPVRWRRNGWEYAAPGRPSV